MSDILKNLGQREIRLYEKLLMIFPGYRGYKEKELIRETDRVVREKLYWMLRRSIDDLRRFYSMIISGGGSGDYARRVENLIYRLDTLAMKTRHAPYGYKPLFHVYKVDEEKLVKMLEHDLKLADLINSLNNTTHRLVSSSIPKEDLGSVLAEIENFVKDYEAKLFEREQLLTGIIG